MKPSPSRVVFALIVVTVILAGTASAVGMETTSEPATQQLLVSELDLQASLTGEFFVAAGWFEITASTEGRLDTRAQESDLTGTFDVDFAETFGEFAYSGEFVGTVNASRILYAFEGNASNLWGAEAVAPVVTLSTTDGSIGAHRDGALVAASASPSFEYGESEPIAPTKGNRPGDRIVRYNSPGTHTDTPLQLRPYRQLGISFFDVYWQLATLLLGLVLVGILPRSSRRVADLAASRPLRTGGAGLAVVLVVPVALLVLGLSLFGIPLAFAGAGLYLALGWVGAVYGRFTIGLSVLGAVPRALAVVDVDVRRVENRWAGLLVGTVVVGLLVQVPVVGTILEAFVVLLGLGGVTRLAYRSYVRTERSERGPTVDSGTGTGDE